MSTKRDMNLRKNLDGTDILCEGFFDAYFSKEEAG